MYGCLGLAWSSVMPLKSVLIELGKHLTQKLVVIAQTKQILANSQLANTK